MPELHNARQAYSRDDLDHPSVYADHACMNDKQCLGKAVVALRKDRGWTQPQLAERAGVDQGRVSKIEQGKVSAPIDVQRKLADAFGLTISSLWRKAEEFSGVEPRSTRDHGDEPVDLSVSDPGKAASRIANDIDALRYAVGAIATAIATTRPDEGDLIVAGLRGVPQKFLEKEGSIHLLLATVEAASRQARKHALVRRGATPESS